MRFTFNMVSVRSGNGQRQTISFHPVLKFVNGGQPGLFVAQLVQQVSAQVKSAWPVGDLVRFIKNPSRLAAGKVFTS